MEPVDPCIPLHLLPPGSKALIAGRNQEEYQDLPSIVTIHGDVITRWQFTPEELRRVIKGADLYITIKSRGTINPIRLSVGAEDWR